MPLISVIMPVFNAVKYIEDTLISLLSQTFTDFELIIVNDGATDGTYEICERFAKLDGRIDLVSKENGGICSARNCGLDRVSGRYIAFCDHDDIYDSRYLEKAFVYMNASNVDLLKFEYHSLGLTENGQIFLDEIQHFWKNEYSLEQLVKMYNCFNQCVRVLWNGLYRYDIIQKYNLRFDDSFKLGMEDYAFNLSYLRYCKRIQTLDECLYTHYMRRKQSAFTKFSKDKLRDIIKVGEQEIRFINNLDIGEELLAVQGMHDSVCISIFLEQITMADSPLTLRNKVKALKVLRVSKALYNAERKQISAVYRNNWKFAVKLHLFRYHLYHLLVWYQQINDIRKGK